MAIRVVVVDDSRLMREVISHVLSQDQEIEVVATAVDPFDARQKIRELSPDVITLDVEMPRMDGLSFLEKIMKLKPTPVVMVSSLTHRGADITLRALEIGAVDFIAKPQALSPEGMAQLSRELCGKVRSASVAKLRKGPVATPARAAAPAARTGVPRANRRAADIIAIGASTGGVEALRTLMIGLPADLPPIVIAQHMPAGFTARFAERLDTLGPLKVAEATDGAPLKRGHVYIAPGDSHLEVKEGHCRLTQASPVNGHRPSVDVLFNSVAKVYGARAVGAILTGMGRDGAQGLLAMRKAGAFTLGQDEASSLIYGMPRAAKEVGALDHVAGISSMAGEIAQAVRATAQAHNAPS